MSRVSEAKIVKLNVSKKFCPSVFGWEGMCLSACLSVCLSVLEKRQIVFLYNRDVTNLHQKLAK